MVEFFGVDLEEGALFVAGVATLLVVMSMFVWEFVDWSSVPLYVRLVVSLATPPLAYFVTVAMVNR